MKKEKLVKRIDQAGSFDQIATLLKKCGFLNLKFMNRLYHTYHIRYDSKRGLFESDLDHPGIFYDCTYQDARECVSNVLMSI